MVPFPEAKVRVRRRDGSPRPTKPEDKSLARRMIEAQKVENLFSLPAEEAPKPKRSRRAVQKSSRAVLEESSSEDEALETPRPRTAKATPQRPKRNTERQLADFEEEESDEEEEERMVSFQQMINESPSLSSEPTALTLSLLMHHPVLPPWQNAEVEEEEELDEEDLLPPAEKEARDLAAIDALANLAADAQHKKAAGKRTARAGAAATNANASAKKPSPAKAKEAARDREAAGRTRGSKRAAGAVEEPKPAKRTRGVVLVPMSQDPLLEGPRRSARGGARVGA